MPMEDRDEDPVLHGCRPFNEKPLLIIPVSFLLSSTISPYFLSCLKSLSAIDPESLATP
ncbi:MAG: hypothetical protein H6Q41_4699 [Deltaproteobacteria bacterium]|nr:hypothetical protein [Deltaproteobacteria bacterium]